MPIYVILVFFVALSIAIAAYGYQRYARPGRVYERLGEPVIEAPTAGTVGEEAELPRPREFKLLQKVGSLVPESGDTSSITRRLLSYAGYRSDHAVKIFYGLKVLGAVIMGIIGLFARDMFGDHSALRMVFPAAATMAGYVIPSFILDKKITKRQKTLWLSLPDALDLLVISIEAGLGLDQALQYVGAELHIAHKELSEELALVNLEIRAGKRRADALK